MNKGKPKDDDLERAFQKTMRGNEHFPELVRQLCAGRLFFLVPYHPENIGESMITNRDRVPFIQVQGPDGRMFVPIYTKMRHAHHAMKNLSQRFSVVEMRGKELFVVLANHNANVAINERAGIGQIRINADMAAQIADGTLLNPPPAPREYGTIRSMNPSEYPTDLVQTLFQFLRSRIEVRAAWIFRQTQPPPGKTAGYVFALLMAAESETVINDFTLVAATSRPKEIDFGVDTIKPGDPVMGPTIKIVPPFFSAPDFHWPQSLG